MPSLSTILAILAFIGPVVSWGVTSAVHKLDAVAVKRAAKVELDAAVAAAGQRCETEKAAIEHAKNEAIASGLREAVDAANGIAPTPIERAEIEALCQRSASCRDRNPKTETR